MATLTDYRGIIERILTEYAGIAYANRDAAIEKQTVFDREKDHYLLVSLGWEKGHRRIYHCIFHVDIIDGKIWIQCDNTNKPIARELLAAGVPRDHIVLGFHPPELRRDTEYAVA
jgi:hypothetical protein